MDFGASIIAVIGLADKVISRCHRYLLGVKDCPSDLRAILVETSNFKAVVENLGVLCQGSPDSDLRAFFHQLNGDTGPVEGSKECLRKLKKLLPVDKQVNAAGGKHKPESLTLARLAWPFHETKAKKLLNELGRLRSSISLALTADISHQVQAIATQVQEIRDQLTVEERERVLKWLVTTDPSWMHSSSCRLREEHTGLWLERSPEFNDWKDGKTRLLWFYGIPGAGKTVLFSHIVESTKRFCDARPKTVCVYYYCYFERNQDEATHLLRWTVAQLARKATYMPMAISNQYEAGEQPSTTILISALAELCSKYDRVYLLIDALDESLARSNLLNVLEILGQNSFENIRALATSREEPDIKYTMRNIAQPISLHNGYVDEDIATYVEAELSRNHRLRMLPDITKAEIQAALVKGARGMFRWAACQLDVLSKLHTVADIRQALRTLPRTLDATYERILLNVPEEHRSRAKMALLLVASPNRFDRPDALAEAIMVDVEGLEYHHQEPILQPEELLLELCSCLIKIDEIDGKAKIRLAHYTVKEYLYSERTKVSKVAYFHGSDELALFLGAMASLIYLLNHSYVGVPSARQFLRATPSEQAQFQDEVQRSSPFLVDAMYSWDSVNSRITNPKMRAELDRLIYILIQPGAPHFRWWEWRAVTAPFRIHPLWESWDGREAQYAISIACFCDLPTLATRILRENPVLASNHGKLELEPLYLEKWINHIRETAEGNGYEDMTQQPQDYLPGGTLLEIVLRLDSLACAELVVASTYNASHYMNAAGLPGLSVAIKSFTAVTRGPTIPFENVVLLLEAGADVNIQPVSETPLQSAAKADDERIIELLLEWGAFLNEVGNDSAIVDSIKLRHEGSAEEDIQRALGNRGLDNRYKTPLRILREGYGGDTIDTDLLEERGALSLHLFPVPGLPGYCAEDWQILEEAGWKGTRRCVDIDDNMSDS